jgi:hypothetical protein
MTKTETFDPARLRELAQGITSGPWYNDSEGVWQVEDIDYGKWQVCNCPWPYAEDNAAFIAYCGTHASDIAAMAEVEIQLAYEISVNSTLAAGSCDVPGGKVGDDHGNSYYTKVKRIAELEAAGDKQHQELLNMAQRAQELEARVAELEKANGNLRGLIVQQADHSKAREVTVWNRAIKSCLAMMKPCNRLDHAEAAIRALKRPTT